MRRQAPAPLPTIDLDPRVKRQRVLSVVRTPEGEHATLECGHTILQALPITVKKMACARCITNLVEEYKSHVITPTR